jgi:hypothetical protein
VDGAVLSAQYASSVQRLFDLRRDRQRPPLGVGAHQPGIETADRDGRERSSTATFLASIAPPGAAK